jgi:hypothetical protein
MGDELDPMAWARRDGDGWSETRRERKPADLLYRGAAAAALVDLLTDRGLSVELSMFFSSMGLEKSRRGERFILRVIVKHADRPMDIGAVALAAAEIAFFRIITMSASGRLARRVLHDRMGYVAPLPDVDAADYDIVLDSDVLTESAAIDAVERHMARFAADLAA